MPRFLLVAVAVLMVGCSIKKDLDKTHQTTQELKEISNDIRNSTLKVLTDGRHSTAGQFSFNWMQKIIEAKSITEKQALAVAYFDGMEYQYWLGQMTDTAEVREQMMYDNLNQFFNHIEMLVKDTYPMDNDGFLTKIWGVGDLAKYQLSSDVENLGVLGVAMSRVAMAQEFAAKKLKFKVYTAYDLIKEGLKYKADKEAHLPIPKWANAVLENEQTAYYLIQLRHNFTLLMTLAKLTALEDNSFLFLFNSFWKGGFKADLDKVNTAQEEKIVDILGKGIDAKVFLKEQNVPLRFSAPVTYFMSKMTLVSSNAVDVRRSYSKLLQDLNTASGRAIPLEQKTPTQ